MPLTELLLLRHAHAEAPSSGQADAERVLSERGRTEARDAAAWIAARPSAPSRIVSSPATRARATAEAAAAALDGVELRFDPRIYEATPGMLLDVIGDHADVDSLLLVGHNPGFEELAALLTSGQSGDHRGLPPAGIAVLGLADNAALEPGAARLLELWSRV